MIDGGNQPTISYDANGNLSNYKGWTYRYDAQNRLLSASNGTTNAQFYYDGKNRQIARNINGVIRFNSWDGWELLEEYSSSLNVATGYLQGSTGVIKSWSAANTLYYYQDKLGSTTHVANASGQLVESYHYDLTGTPTETSTHGVVDLYAGERWIPELRLYDLRNRFMSPELGRFLQTDPIGFKGDGSNLYRYCGNDAVDRSDPTGLIPTDWTWSHLMWEQGNSSYGFNDLYQSYVNAGASGGGSATTGTGMPTREANLAPKSDRPTSDTTTSMTMTIAVDPVTGQQKSEDGGYYRFFSVQLTQPNGKAQDGRGWYAQEAVKVRSTSVPAMGA